MKPDPVRRETRLLDLLLFLWGTAGVLFSITVLWIFFPEWFGKIYLNIIPEYVGRFPVFNMPNAGASVQLIIAYLCLQRLIIHFLIVFYHVRYEAVFLTILWMIIFMASNMTWIQLNMTGKARRIAVNFFQLLLIFIVLFSIFPSWKSILYAFFVFAVYYCNLIKYYELNNRFRRRLLIAFIAILAPTGIPLVLFPSLLFSLAISPIVKGASGRRIVSRMLMLATTPLVFYFLGVLYLSAKPIFLSEAITPIKAMRGFYDLTVCQKNSKLIATIKNPKNYEDNCCIFSLNSPVDGAKSLRVHSIELEDIELDEERNVLYHVARENNLLLIIDPKTMSEFAIMPLTFSVQGSVKLSYYKNGDILAIGMENSEISKSGTQDGCLVFMSLFDFSIRYKLYFPGAHPVVIPNPKNNSWIVHLRKTRELLSLDMDSYEQTHEASIPATSMDECLSSKKNEIYISDYLGRVLVFSAVDLKKKPSISVDFGARALAVDEERELLFVGSMISGNLTIINLLDGSIVSRQYVGPYFRRIALDTRRRTAYMSLMEDGLFMLRY